MEQQDASISSPEVDPPLGEVKSTRQLLSATALADVRPTREYALDLSSPARQPGKSQEQINAMVAEIHAEELAVLLHGVHEPALRAKIEDSYWTYRELHPRFS